MENKNIIVKNCKSCPFSETTYNISSKQYSTCLCPLPKEKFNITSYFKNFKNPKWCPLLQNNLNIIHNKTIS